MAKQEIKSAEKSFYDIVNNPENFTIKNETDDNSEQNSLDELEECPTVDRDGRDEITLLDSITDTPPQSIYKSSNQTRPRTLKKEKEYKQKMKAKTSFKEYNHRSRKKNVERYVERHAKNLCNITNEINSQSISKRVSLCDISKGLFAKESLVDDLNFEIDENITFLPCSKESNISTSSQNTLTLMNANKSVENNIHGTDTVIFIVDEPNRPNIINVSRVDNLTFNNRGSTPKSSRDLLLDDQDLTNNTNTLVGLIGLTSAPDSNEMLAHSSNQGAFITSCEASVEALIQKQRDIDESSLNSLSSLRITIAKSNNSSCDNFPNSSLSCNKQKIMHTVIDLGMFPEMTAHLPLNSFNDVIVAGSLFTNFTPLVKDDKEKLTAKEDENNYSNIIPIKNVAQKSSNPPIISDIKPKSVKLPNESILNDLLKLNEKYETDKVKVECQSVYPSNINELWETLIAALNARVQKLEKTLTDKILTEMNISLNVLDKLRQLSEENVNTQTLNKSFCTHDQVLQCDLLEPLKSCTMATETDLSNSFLTDSKEVQYNLEPSLEVLKPALKASGDSEAILTSIAVEVKPAPFVATSTKSLISRFPILNFISENAVVLAATPIFIIMLICIYFLINTIVNSL